MTSIIRAYSICSHQRVSAPAHPAPLCPRGCSRATAPLSSPGVIFQLLGMIATQINPAILLVWQARKAFTSRVHKTIAAPSISSSKESKFPMAASKKCRSQGPLYRRYFCKSMFLRIFPSEVVSWNWSSFVSAVVPSPFNYRRFTTLLHRHLDVCSGNCEAYESVGATRTKTQPSFFHSCGGLFISENSLSHFYRFPFVQAMHVFLSWKWTCGCAETWRTLTLKTSQDPKVGPTAEYL